MMVAAAMFVMAVVGWAVVGCSRSPEVPPAGKAVPGTAFRDSAFPGTSPTHAMAVAMFMPPSTRNSAPVQ